MNCAGNSLRCLKLSGQLNIVYAIYPSQICNIITICKITCYSANYLFNVARRERFSSTKFSPCGLSLPNLGTMFGILPANLLFSYLVLHFTLSRACGLAFD